MNKQPFSWENTIDHFESLPPLPPAALLPSISTKLKVLSRKKSYSEFQKYFSSDHSSLASICFSSWGFGNNGCDGGEDFRAYQVDLLLPFLYLNLDFSPQWMLAHGGIPTEDSYGPYLGQDGYCRADKATVGLKIKVRIIRCYHLAACLILLEQGH